MLIKYEWWNPWHRCHKYSEDANLLYTLFRLHTRWTTPEKVELKVANILLRKGLFLYLQNDTTWGNRNKLHGCLLSENITII
jgi:hypothetical protein